MYLSGILKGCPGSKVLSQYVGEAKRFWCQYNLFKTNTVLRIMRVKFLCNQIPHPSSTESSQLPKYTQSHFSTVQNLIHNKSKSVNITQTHISVEGLPVVAETPVNGRCRLADVEPWRWLQQCGLGRRKTGNEGPIKLVLTQIHRRSLWAAGSQVNFLQSMW